MSTGAGKRMPGSIAAIIGVAIASSCLENTVMAQDAQPGRITLAVAEDHSVIVRVNGSPIARFEPTFVVFFTETDPKLALRPLGEANYNVVSWYTGKKGPASIDAPKDSPFSVGDGFDPSILQGDHQGRTTDIFAAAPRTTVRATSAQQSNGSVAWRFDDDPRFTLKATVSAPAGSSYPVLTYTFRAKQDGYYSVAYVGAPATELARVKSLWQPLVWNAKRFPEHSYVTMAFRCPLPGAFVCDGERTTSVVADPQHIPFMPLPRLDNSQFGVALRDPAGQARPMILAPVLGGPGSEMEADQTFTFRAHLVSYAGDVDGAVEDVARKVYQFTDERRNTDYSLNDTLENMIDYGMSEYSRFNEDLRGASYATDVPGAVKNVSALHPLTAALVTDNPAIYEHRARPVMEYVLSREKFLFVTDPSIVGQRPGWKMHGPCAPVTELAALAAMTHGRNPQLLHLAKQMLDEDRVLNLDVPTPGKTWQALLAIYWKCASKWVPVCASNRVPPRVKE